MPDDTRDSFGDTEHAGERSGERDRGQQPPRKPTEEYRRGMNPRTRTIIWIILSAIALCAVLSSVIVWNSALRIVKAEAAQDAKREVSGKQLQEQSKKLDEVRDSASGSLAHVAPAVARAIRTKDKLNAFDVSLVQGILTIFKTELEMADAKVDQVERETRALLEDDHREQGLANVKAARKHLANLRIAHTSLETEVQTAFKDMPAPEKGSDKSKKMMDEVWKQVEDALNKLAEDKEKENKKDK